MALSLTFRNATARDAAVVTQLLAELIVAEGYTIPANMDDLARGIFADTRTLHLRVLVAENMATGVVALLLYYPGYDTLTMSEGYHVADMVVRSDLRGQGIGKQLLGHLGKQAMAENLHWLFLTALRTNESACAFYASLGFADVHVRCFAIDAPSLARFSLANA